MVNAAGLCLVNVAGREAEVVWEQEGIHGRQAGLCLRSAPSSKGGYGILLCCSAKTELRWVARWARCGAPCLANCITAVTR